MTSGRLTPDAVVIRPVVSEKTYSAMDMGKYVFRCVPNANKVEIKAALETMFADDKVKIISVRTMNMRGKQRIRTLRGRRITGFGPNWKKAVVTVAPGTKIPGMFEGV